LAGAIFKQESSMKKVILITVSLFFLGLLTNACGNDGESKSCSTPGEQRCSDDQIQSCEANQFGGTWTTTTDCTESGLYCNDASGYPSCSSVPSTDADTDSDTDTDTDSDTDTDADVNTQITAICNKSTECGSATTTCVSDMQATLSTLPAACLAEMSIYTNCVTSTPCASLTNCQTALESWIYSAACTGGSTTECAAGCPASYIADGYCDTGCNVAACSYDGGDCTATTECATGCPASYIADGYCDTYCNVAACSYDGGDCG
jgi:hypothetical protein